MYCIVREHINCKNCKFMKNIKDGKTNRPYCMKRHTFLTAFYWCYDYKKKY